MTLQLNLSNTDFVHSWIHQRKQRTGGYMENNARRGVVSFRRNSGLARLLWGDISSVALKSLKELTANYGFSVAAGDLLLIDGRWYVTHAGLLRIAARRRCVAIETSVESHLSNPTANHWVFKATVYKGRSRKGFSGHGDADPSNVSSQVRGAEMRVAETRAVNRALRKAYGIGLCSVEELGTFSSPARSSTIPSSSNTSHSSNGSNNGHPRLRDQLCLLIRKYELDPVRVKRYAADFCGTEVLRDAGRDLVESFIATLADQAAKDREGLICKLNSYSNTEAVKS
jgi:hypothetical protein